MKTWQSYISFIRNNILNSSTANKDLKYWQDYMFTNTIIYVIPFSIIALIPSLIWSFEPKLYKMFIVDICAILVVFFIGFKEQINIKYRKLLFISTVYTLSSFLIYYVGLNSSLYLLATCFISTCIYTFKNQYTPALINVYISIGYIALHYKNLTPPNNLNFSTIELFAVFSNLVFLSFLICALIRKLFNGLDESFKKSIEHNLKIEKQNEALKEITWIQSHVVRAPLSKLMAITELLKNYDTSDEEKIFYIENIDRCTDELDGLIRDIVAKSESIRSSNEK
ncbi:hypothetical protein [Flavobacterium faecale]|uniref:hypothetical protein n=1 Tax=Flavobacterium faecale TaxID=1355330 RepID=UPI003AABC03C